MSGPVRRFASIASSGLGFIMALTLAGCGDDKGSGPPSAAESFLSGFKTGDSRLLLKELKAEGRTYGYDLYTVAEIRIEQDTLIEGAPAKAFTITASEFFPESTYVRTGRQYLVAQGDSLNLYQSKEGGSSLSFGLLKRGVYDTSRFSDKTAEWVFPLVEGSHWLTRPPGGDNWSLEKEWIGKENLVFEGQEYACDVFVLHSVVDLKSWVAPMGLLKAEVEYGPYIITDSEGNELDTAMTSVERYELLKLNPTAEETAAAKAKYESLTWENMPKPAVQALRKASTE